MSKTKGGAKALALAVGFTVLAGGYGLNPVYAADTTSVSINSGSVNFSYSTYDFVGTINNGSATVNNSDIAAALNGQAITGVTSLKVDNVTIDETTVTVGSDGTALADGSLTIGANNTWTSEKGIVASKATFGANINNQTTIADGVITSSDGSEYNKTVINKGIISSNAADINTNLNASFDFNYSGISSTVTNQQQHTEFKQGVQSFSSKVMKDTDLIVSQEIAYDQTNGGSIVGTVATVNTVTQNKDGFKVASIATGNNSAFDFKTDTGVATFTNATDKTTTIDGDTVTIGGEEGKQTIIAGDEITTNTLKVENIVLGGTIKDKDGNDVANNGGKLTISSDGSMSAASGNFTVSEKGAVHSVVAAADADEGGKTSFETTTTGGTLQFEKADTSTSSVSVSEGSASMKVGENGVTVTDTQITEKVGDDTNTTTVTTTNSSFEVKGKDDKGFSVDTTTGATTFTGNSTHYGSGTQETTVIDGNKITTGSITTDQLIITGKGEANGEGTGTITLAGDGSIKSNIKENDKETTFNTDVEGTHTTVTSKGVDESTSTTKSDVTASGVTTEVESGDKSSLVQQAVDKNESTIKNGAATSQSTQTVEKSTTNITNGQSGDDKKESSFTQDTTSIGGVVTNGDVSVSQKLDAAAGSITNTVTSVDADNNKVQSNVVQTTDGLEINDKVDGGESKNKTLVTATDVSITDTREGRNDERISLSQLGNLNDLDSELSNREEYTSNKTAVGAINAEAQVRREEVARLDRRIDDVNERVDKVGAMAAAIASLKSMGYDPQAPSEFSVGLGQYKGETGVALGFFHYPNKNFMINVSLSTSGGETMGGVGATWRFGYKSPQKLLNEQRAAQAKKELAAAEKYRVAAQLAKEAQERAEYAAKLARQAQVSADNAKAAADATQAKIAD